jgi:hypothetical protein
MCEVTAKMNAIPKMDKFGRKCIFLGEVAKVGGGCLDQVPYAFQGHGEINKIAKSIEANGPKKKKVGRHFTTKSLSRNMSRGKEAK